MTTSTVTLLGGSRPGSRAQFATEVAHLVDTLVVGGYQIRYGGGATGLMGTIADTALASGGHVHGVIPQFLANAEVLHSGLTETTVVQTMAQRKQILLAGIDAVVVVPGGIGTLEEFFDIFSQLVLGESTARLVVFDCLGFWGPLNRLLAALTVNEFMSWPEFESVRFANTPDEVLEFLRAPWTPPPSRTSKPVAAPATAHDGGVRA